VANIFGVVNQPDTLLRKSVAWASLVATTFAPIHATQRTHHTTACPRGTYGCELSRRAGRVPIRRGAAYSSGIPNPGVFTQEYEELVGAIAAQAVIAVDNAHLHAAAQSEIAERRRVERLACHLASIVESSRDAIISVDLHDTIISWNKGAEQLYGYTAEAVVGQSISILFPPDYTEDGAALLERIRRGEPVDHYETVRRRKDGNQRD
jgi:PAS domain S-box-containing protein